MSLPKIASSIVAVLALIGSIVLTAPAAPAQAANGADFRADMIISDEAFFNNNAMTEAQVQSFLESKEAGCTAKNGQPCLKDYRVTSSDKAPQGANHCGAYTGEANERASRVIWKVAQACRINPQVLLVTLQKERGLVTNTAPISADYKVSMGYACPDTAACDTQFFGFFNQMYKAAWQFRQYTVSPNYWRYKIGNVSVQWHPNAACGSTVVNIKNQATANLYNYTPYQPNAAALRNMYAVGDSCSSYGNRNFFAYFTDWFGSTSYQKPLVGSVDNITASFDTVQVRGWALDPDSKANLAALVKIDGKDAGMLNTDKSRPDVARVYPDWGAQRGYEGEFTVAGGGKHEVCVLAVSASQITPLKCSTVDVPSASPTTALDVVSGIGKVHIEGWAFDPEQPQKQLEVHVYVDGRGTPYVANSPRADVGRVYPAAGPNHGFNLDIAASDGTHDVCVFAINIGKGSNKLLTCESVTVRSGAPIGVVDSVAVKPGSVTVTGWTLDPDTAASNDVHIYVDGKGQSLTASANRPDIARVYPGYGSAHGFSKSFDLKPGAHSVCVFGINKVGPGGNTLMNCSDVTVPGGSPFGVVDSVSVSGKDITAQGWVIDPDTQAAADVHLYVNGKGYSFPANAVRPDIARIYPMYGGNHGFAKTVTVDKAGSYSVCAFGINTGSGSDTLMYCTDVTVR
ncbi:hypothetical protein ACUWEX_10610 [Okibacterium fritillariae]|uniref:hypothetical protein n=1 Tax=Okibacterium fritillariae TaxID=123320 RepID=UPI0040558F10